MLSTTIAAAAAAITTALAGSSAINMYQTYSVTEKVSTGRGSNDAFPWELVSSGSPLLREYISADGTTPTPAQVAAEKTAAEVVSDLREMPRRDLLALFLACEAPEDATAVGGEWNGLLLENNGPLMTAVSAFLSNRLFGRGRIWNGKAIGVGAAEEGDSGAGGINRFYPGKERGVDGEVMDKEHRFDCSVQPSRLDCGTKSLLMEYAPYQGRLSLWRGMRDELRVLRPPSGENGEGGVLLGMGCMTWSGAFLRDGFLNCAPFCVFIADK